MFVCIFRDGAGECLDTGGGGVQTLDVPRYKVRPVCRAPCLVWGPLYTPCGPPSEGNSLAGSRMKVAGCWHWWPGDMCCHTALPLPPLGHRHQYCDQAQGQGSDTGIVYHAYTLTVNQSSILSHTLFLYLSRIALYLRQDWGALDPIPRARLLWILTNLTESVISCCCELVLNTHSASSPSCQQVNNIS